ncbi:unnamed protein product [Lymnaea stagnalis]|uniref:Uncharacterized protein n=1 Tax=Lymnaea stagnalis TaxID=6523 RepID=A0AAV2H9Y0_LYMST
MASSRQHLIRGDAEEGTVHLLSSSIRGDAKQGTLHLISIRGDAKKDTLHLISIRCDAKQGTLHLIRDDAREDRSYVMSHNSLRIYSMWCGSDFPQFRTVIKILNLLSY